MSGRETHEALRLSALSRRHFLVAAGGASCAVLFGGASALAAPGVDGAHASIVNSWVTLHADGWIDIVCPGIELGQGSTTALPRFLAEELDADWARVRVIPAPADEKKYGNPLFWGIQITAGSRTTLGYFDVLRIAGAEARNLLLLAAARRWGVPLDELSTADSVVSHRRSGRRIGYGDLVRDVRVPEAFPDFLAADEIVQVPDDFFGEPPPSVLVPDAKRREPIRLKARSAYRLIGVDTPRRDIPPKVRGAADYGIDVQVPGMVYATVVTGDVLDDIPASVDDRAARAVPGVTDVVRLPYGVAVVGSGFGCVLQASTLLKIGWQPGPRRGGYDSGAVLDDFARMAADPGHLAARAWEKGDPAVALKALAGPGVMRFDMRSELIYHAPIEPQNATVRVAPDGRSAEVWVGTQWPQREREAVAKVLGIDAAAVTLNMVAPGGSFGRRQEPGAVIDAAHVAKALRRPVKLLWSRQEDAKRNPYRQAMACGIEAAVADTGRILAMRHRVVADSWFAQKFGDWFEQYKKTDPGNWSGAICAYDVPNQLIDAITDRRDVDLCYMRGIGVSQIKFAQESLIDAIATRHKIDPLHYRLELMKAEPRATAVLEAVATWSDWKARRAEPAKDGALGLAYTLYSNAHAALVADVSVDRASGEIRVHELWCVVDVGLAAQPDGVAAQIEGGILQGLSIALYEQITLHGGVVQEKTFADYPLLRMAQTPRMNVRIVSTHNAIAGAGEIGTMQIAPAINNALAAIIGKPLTSLPMLPEKVKQALGQA